MSVDENKGICNIPCFCACMVWFVFVANIVSVNSSTRDRRSSSILVPGCSVLVFVQGTSPMTTITVVGLSTQPLDLPQFTAACTTLATELRDSQDPIKVIEILANVMSWFEASLTEAEEEMENTSVATPFVLSFDDHQLHFITIALPKCIEALMQRSYTDILYTVVVNLF